MCAIFLWPLLPVGRSDGNTSQRVHKSLWIEVIDCVTLQELFSLSGYFGSGWVIRHKPSQISSPKLLLYHQLNVPFHGFLDLANFLQFITPGRAKFNRNWNSKLNCSQNYNNSHTNFQTKFLGTSQIVFLLEPIEVAPTKPLVQIILATHMKVSFTSKNNPFNFFAGKIM